MTTQQVAERSFVSVHTIRFYEKTGVIPRVKRTPHGIRNFSEADLTLIQFIEQLKEAGISLHDITTFTEDGCILEQLQQGTLSSSIVHKRLDMLQNHKQALKAKQRNMNSMLQILEKKINFYSQYTEEANL
jgi:DNA-binding transcriptional MerR regulator